MKALGKTLASGIELNNVAIAAIEKAASIIGTFLVFCDLGVKLINGQPRLDSWHSHGPGQPGLAFLTDFVETSQSVTSRGNVPQRIKGVKTHLLSMSADRLNRWVSHDAVIR